jgi:hypothetical protein
VPGYRPISFGELAGFEFSLNSVALELGATNSTASGVVEQIPGTVRQLDGQRVALQGFLVPLRMDEGLAVEFMLLRDQTLCCYGKLPQVNEWVLVHAEGRGVKPDMDVPLTVCGRLEVGDQRDKGVFVGLYRLQAERIIRAK